MSRIVRPEAGRSLLAGRPDHTSYGTGWLLKLLTGQQNLFAPISDPAQAGHAQRHHLGVGGGIRHGYVVDYVAYAHCYRVFLDNNHPIIPCTPLLQGSAVPWGARPLLSLPPGCPVQVIVHPQRLHGYIVGVEPRVRATAADSRSDWISQSGRCGVRVDGAHRQVFECTGKGGVINWSSDRPMDALAGEAGWIAETGLRIALDPFFVQLAVNEICGIFGFYHDELLRIAAYNLHHFTCGGELEVLDDEGEVRWVGGDTPYPWEQLGCLVPGIDPFRDVDPQQAQVATPHYSYIEPADDHQLPFHRLLEFRGYLGQGGKRMIVVPPDGQRYGYSGPGPKGVYDEFRGLDGRWAVRSAKGIHIAKRTTIPVPRPRLRPEDRDGDNPENYRAAGLVGSGSEHVITGGPKALARLPHLQQAASIADLHAWVFNWQGCHPFHYHGRDWDLPEESASALGNGHAPSFGYLSSSFYLPRPDAAQLKVDHRYGEVDYYPNEVSLDMTDDGAFLVGDGYGAEIQLVGGHIFLRSPADIWLLAGRNVNVWAGRDFCVRARNSFDVSATDGDGRIKAERNLHMLGGNAAAGGVLLESKSPSAYGYDDAVGEDVVSGGIQLKAAKGGVTSWSRDIYLRVGGGDVESGGQIILDADKGKSVIVTTSLALLNYVTESTVDYFGTSGAIRSANIYSDTGNLLGRPLEVVGDAIFRGSMLIRGWFEAVGGHIATELAQDPAYRYVSPLKDRPLQQARQALQETEDAEQKAVADGKKTYRSEFTNSLYADDGAGNDKTIASIHFTFRSAAQYRTVDFTLYEARWQQLMRLAGGGKTWSERPVTVANRETYPYPGKEIWKDGEHLYTQDLVLVDPATGVAAARSEALGEYERPSYKEGRPEKLDGNYIVIA
jgi:hypothetical protein